MSHTQWAVAAAAAFTVLQWALIPQLLAQRAKSPPAVLAWLWALILFPIIGAILYLLIGSERVARKRLALVRVLDSELGPDQPAPDDCAMPELARVNGFPPTAGNSASLLPDGTSFFPVMLEVIANAQHHVHLIFYIWARDRAGTVVRDALVEAAKRGVQVRVLVDEMGSLWLRRSFFAPLIAAGGEFSWFNTFSPRRGRFHLNLRNHRKLVVADGTVALTGGMNVGNIYWSGEGGPPHRDLAVRLRGPVVRQLAEIFGQDWFFATGRVLKSHCYYPVVEAGGEVQIQVVPGAPDNEIDEVQLTTLALIHRAKERILLMTPYFVPEAPLLAALQLAAMRGVQVNIVVPEKGDHFYLTHVMRSYFDDLLPHGVRIFLYLPRMLHAKVVTVDGQFTMTGSANLDIRSQRLNFELNVVLTSTHLAEAVDRFFAENSPEFREMTLEEYQRRPLRDRIGEAIFRPAAPLL